MYAFRLQAVAELMVVMIPSFMVDPLKSLPKGYSSNYEIPSESGNASPPTWSFLNTVLVLLVFGLQINFRIGLLIAQNNMPGF